MSTVSTDGRPEIVFEHEDFEFVSLEDEVRVDERCQELLRHFYLNLLAGGMPAEQASGLAYAADYYVRDYVLDFCRQNIARPEAGLVTRFAASWFITRTLDPEMGVLKLHLDAVQRFYRYLRSLHLISSEELSMLEEESSRDEYYMMRIETFMGISGDGYVAWEAECPLKRA